MYININYIYIYTHIYIYILYLSRVDFDTDVFGGDPERLEE